MPGPVDSATHPSHARLAGMPKHPAAAPPNTAFRVVRSPDAALPPLAFATSSNRPLLTDSFGADLLATAGATIGDLGVISTTCEGEHVPSSLMPDCERRVCDHRIKAQIVT